MLSSDQHDTIVSRLYAAALGEEPWTATLSHIAGSFGQSAALVQVADPETHAFRVENHGYSREFAEEFYAGEIYANDPRIPYYWNVAPGSIYFDHCLYDMAEIERNQWCQECFATLKVKYQLGAVLRLQSGTTGFLTLLSTAAEGHASEAAVRSFHRLAPHIEQACALGQVLGHRIASEAALTEALAAKADGVILLSRHGKPVFLNDVARAILAAGDGLALADDGFVTRRGPETRRLRLFVARAVSAGRSDACPGSAILITRPSGRRPYVLRILPAPPATPMLAALDIGCVIHIHDLAVVAVPSAAGLGSVFGLTEREADLAIELVRSTSLAVAATAARMSHNTARNHLQGIFRKCGVASQAEAVQLLGRLP